MRRLKNVEGESERVWVTGQEGAEDVLLLKVVQQQDSFYIAPNVT